MRQTKSKKIPKKSPRNKPISARHRPITAIKQAKTRKILKKAPLPEPFKADPLPGSAEFVRIQAAWYAKLKGTGFKDLEVLNKGTGEMHPHLNGASLYSLRHAALTGRETYFRRLTNYLTHNPRWSKDALLCNVARLYIKGLSYRKMLGPLKGLGYRTSIWTIHKIVKALEAKAWAWNKTHPEGLDFEADFEPITTKT